MKVRISTHVGLGDQVYMRPFVLALADSGHEVYLGTPWPELYWDRPDVLLVPVHRGLRTQEENVRRSGRRWAEFPVGDDTTTINLTYTPHLVLHRPVVQALLHETRQLIPLQLENLNFQLPLPPDCMRSLWPVCDKPLAVFRPPTLRREWLCPARNPDPSLWGPLLQRLRETHHIHWVASTKDGEEWIEGGLQPDPRDTATLHGELSWVSMAWMMKLADLCVGPVGNIIPLGLAVGARIFVLFGGHLPPSMLVHPRMEQYKGQWNHVAPTRFCFCIQNKHACNKHIPISTMLQELEKALDRSAGTTSSSSAITP